VTLVRTALAAVAVAACAWFLLGAVQAHEIDRATAILATGTELSPGRAAQARSALNSAGTLNPDTTVTLLRARLAELQHQPKRAIALGEQVVAEEPQNLDAWLALAQVAASAHRLQPLDRAVAALARLDPRLSHSHP
jgi:predicted Zn-dependent protease